MNWITGKMGRNQTLLPNHQIIGHEEVTISFIDSAGSFRMNLRLSSQAI
jgi:hypothetical protein